MAFRLTLGVLLAAVVAGCGSSPPSPESVARAWSNALNADDNETAAKLFAPNAEIVQGANAFKLATHKEAVAWNAALPCSGRIVAVKSHGATVTVTFVLGDRKTTKCDGPGQHANAIFRVRQGKIVLWHQAPSEQAPTGPTV